VGAAQTVPRVLNGAAAAIRRPVTRSRTCVLHERDESLAGIRRSSIIFSTLRTLNGQTAHGREA
jgi:hypothetical protein